MVLKREEVYKYFIQDGTLRRFISVDIHFREDEGLLGFIVADVNFDMFLVDTFVHGEILITFGLFFAIAEYEILMFHELMVEKEKITTKFSNLKQMNYFIL